MLFSGIMYEMLNFGYHLMGKSSKKKESNTQGEQLFHRFMKAVAEDDGTHRSVAYYADMLCYSPKYISHVVKENSGKTPLEWINKHTIEMIEHKLRFTDCSIKQLSYDFDFPNVSFFCKYVKKHLNISPNKLRQSPALN